MPGVTYQGQDGQAYKFVTDAGAIFSAFVAESLVPKLPPVGQRLEIEAQTKTSKNGSTYQKVVAINGERATFSGKMGGGGGRPYDARAFVSNVVSSAIEAGLIKEPAGIELWATTAFSVITGIGPKSALQETGTASAQVGATPATPTPPGGGAPPNDAIPF